MFAKLSSDVKNQRSIMQIEPIHAQVGPVKAYAKQIADFKNEPFSVVTIPAGSAAYGMGYRFVSIPDSEIPFYIESGAALVAS